MNFKLEYCETEVAVERVPILEVVTLLFDNPFQDWCIVRKLPEPGFFLLEANGITMACHEDSFERIQDGLYHVKSAAGVKLASILLGDDGFMTITGFLRTVEVHDLKCGSVAIAFTDVN